MKFTRMWREPFDQTLRGLQLHVVT